MNYLTYWTYLFVDRSRIKDFPHPISAVDWIYDCRLRFNCDIKLHRCDRNRAHSLDTSFNVSFSDCLHVIHIKSNIILFHFLWKPHPHNNICNSNFLTTTNKNSKQTDFVSEVSFLLHHSIHMGIVTLLSMERKVSFLHEMFATEISQRHRFNGASVRPSLHTFFSHVK